MTAVTPNRWQRRIVWRSSWIGWQLRVQEMCWVLYFAVTVIWSATARLFICHDELWYQLKHGLQVWAMLPHKGVFNVSSLSTREGIDGSSNAQEEMAQTSLRKEQVCYKRTKLAKQPNNHKTVAHIINPGRITIRPCHWFSMTAVTTNHGTSLSMACKYEL